MKATDIVHFLYAMRRNADGSYFAKFHFDEQFKGNLDEIKYLMTSVRLHTEVENGATKIRFSRYTINLHGTFYSFFGKELYELFLLRIKNKPKNY